MAESFCSDGVRRLFILSEQNLISAVSPYISSPNNSPSSRFFLKMKETFWALALFSLFPFKRDLGRPETANPVSYTHLDVYKRQGLRRSAPAF